MTAYHLRIIERLWGTQKFTVSVLSPNAPHIAPHRHKPPLTAAQSFLLSTLPYTTLIPPLLLALILRPLSLNTLNYLPAGPTPILFALLAQYHFTIPHIYKYRLATSSPSTTTPQSGGRAGLIFSDKSLTYLLAAQLALSQVPGSLISALVGWCIGYSWRNEILPGATRWRIPNWVLREKRGGEGYEGLRRRLEGEREGAIGGGGSVASGVEGRVAGEQGRQRRTLGTQILDQFRGVF